MIQSISYFPNFYYIHPQPQLPGKEVALDIMQFFQLKKSFMLPNESLFLASSLHFKMMPFALFCSVKHKHKIPSLNAFSNFPFFVFIPLFFLVLQMAEEISKPLSAANKVTMVSSGGSEVGASKLAGEVLDIMTRLPSAVEKLTGIDISQVSWSMCVKHLSM